MSCAEIVSIILSAFALLISIISIIIGALQNRKLHNENIELNTRPYMSIDLLFDKRIAIHPVPNEKLRICESEYAQLYVKNFVRYADYKNPLFIILVKNVGNAVAKNIIIKELKLKTETSQLADLTDRMLVFESCAQGEQKANKIYIDLKEEEIKEVDLTIEYTTILDKTVVAIYHYQADRFSAMLRHKV